MGKCCHEPLALFESDRLVLLPPDHKDRPWVLTHTFQLIPLIHFRIAYELREASKTKTSVTKLFPVTGRPIGKALRMKKIVELAGGPIPLVKEYC